MKLTVEGKLMISSFVLSVLAIVGVLVLFLLNQRDALANAFGVFIALLTTYFLAKLLRRIHKEGVVI